MLFFRFRIVVSRDFDIAGLSRSEIEARDQKLA